jgi:hypothetical protein
MFVASCSGAVSEVAGRDDHDGAVGLMGDLAADRTHQQLLVQYSRAWRERAEPSIPTMMPGIFFSQC